MPDRVVFALYGCGERTNALVDSVIGSGQVAVSSCYDLDPGRAAEAARKYRARAVDSPAGILGDPAANAVLVSLFPAAHADAIRAAVLSGKAVYAEKPVATTLAEARELVDLVRRTGAHCRVGFVQRFVPLFEKIREMIASGETGELITVEYEWLLWPSPNVTGESETPNWRGDPATGGELLQHAGHVFDLLASWAGEFESVIAATNHVLFPRSPSENSVYAVFRHRGRPTLSFFHWSLVSRYNNVRGRIEGTELTLEYEWNRDPRLRVYRGETPPGRREPDEEIRGFEASHDTGRIMGGFIDEVLSGRPPEVPIEVGLKTLEATFAVRESARTGRAVAFPFTGS